MEWMFIWKIIIVPLIRTMGKDWFKEKFELSDELNDLIFEAIDDPTKIVDVIHYLRNNKTEADKLQGTLEREEIAEQIEITVFPKRGLKLEYYKELITWIFKKSISLKQHLVVKGFLNGQFKLSYFIPDSFEAKAETFRIHNDKIVDNFHLKIYIEEFDSIEERDETYEKRINDLIFSSDQKFNFSFLNNLKKVDSIYDNYIKYEETVSDMLNDSRSSRHRRGGENDSEIVMSSNVIPDELRITDYSVLQTMKESVDTYISNQIEDINQLKSNL